MNIYELKQLIRECITEITTAVNGDDQEAAAIETNAIQRKITQIFKDKVVGLDISEIPREASKESIRYMVTVLTDNKDITVNHLNNYVRKKFESKIPLISKVARLIHPILYDVEFRQIVASTGL